MSTVVKPVIAGLDPATQDTKHRARGAVDPLVKPAGDEGFKPRVRQ